MSDKNDLTNRSKWRIKKEIEQLSTDDAAKKRKKRLDDIRYQNELRKELDSIEVLLDE